MQYNTIQYKKHLYAPFPKSWERLQKNLNTTLWNYNCDQVHILKKYNKTKLRNHETIGLLASNLLPII